MSTQHEYTDEQIQAAIDAAFAAQDELPFCNLQTYADGVYWPHEAPNRLALARAFLAALPKPEAMTSDEGALATSNPYVVSISTKDCDPMDAATAEALGAMVKAATAALPKAETQPTELDVLRNTWGRVSAAVDAIDHKGDNTSIEDVLSRLAVFKAPEGHETLPFFAAPHEVEAIHELCKLQGMSQQAVLRQALRCYQQEVLRRHGITADLPKPAPWTLPAEASAEPEQAQSSEIAGLCSDCGEAVTHRPGKPGEFDHECKTKPADDGPPWIAHDGGPCPLKDEEVEEWEVRYFDGTCCRFEMPISKGNGWVPLNNGGYIHYRVLKWKPGHGPQAASKADEPATFEAHGKTWTRHTPGDPCPVDKNVDIDILDRLQKVWTTKDCPDRWWTAEYSNPIIGWRYAAEAARAEAANADAEWDEHLQKLMSPIPKPWTPAPGDVVRLKSGGPEMTVFYVNEGDKVKTTRFDGATPVEAVFPAACLTPAEEERP